MKAGVPMNAVTTPGGISVAIPCLIAYAFLVQTGNTILDDVERYGSRILLILRARKTDSFFLKLQRYFEQVNRGYEG